jgi:hypothetical protein
MAMKAAFEKVAAKALVPTRNGQGNTPRQVHFVLVLLGGLTGCGGGLDDAPKGTGGSGVGADSMSGGTGGAAGMEEAAGGVAGAGEASVTCGQACARTVNCPNDPDPRCVAACLTGPAMCVAEQQSVWRCVVVAPEADLECSEDGFTSLRGDACHTEVTEMATCLVRE